MSTRPMTQARQEAFLKSLAFHGVIAAAADAAGVTRQAVDYWRKDPEFEEAFKAAMEDAADRIEREAIRRAVEGVDRPVINQGEPTLLYELDERGRPILEEVEVVERVRGKERRVKRLRPKLLLDENGRPQVLTTKVYSDTLLQTVLKGFRAEKYREQSKVEVAGSPDLVEAILAARRRAGEGNG